MSTSPFMTSGQSRRRREDSRRRRRRRRAAIAGALALAILAALVAMAARSNTRHQSRAHRHASIASSRAPARSSAAPIAPVALSPAGLPLGAPPLALKFTAVDGSSVQPAFVTPPRAGVLFNLSTGQVLWRRNAFRRLRIASLTKMMTALLTVQSEPPRARVLITHAAVNASGSKVGVLPLGRHVRLETMLYGLLLPSGNDAAVALAERVSGSVNRFVARMNQEAAKLGLGCTRYSSPSGYIDQGNYSCAANLAVLAHADLEQPRIARIVHTYTAALPFPIKGGRLFLYNNNPLLIYRYPGLTGLKTGFTDAAGRCLVATAERRGVRLGVVLLNSPDPATQARRLLNSGFEHVYHQPPVPEPPIPPGA
jgi:serine-type D-Ala-D-Ala carboxypeptidase (penicillin-binding protein 5/6)